MSLPIGSVTVARPGTPVALVSSGNAVSAVSLRARVDNAGSVFVGDTSVSSTSGYRLEPGDELSLSFKETMDLRRIYVDASNANDGLDYAGVAA